MKASALIIELQRTIDRYGDKEVRVELPLEDEEIIDNSYEVGGWYYHESGNYIGLY